eukprot:CAMPEP_0170245604 /NCGR_PEP_ID=MMETSP0116_2-20130129/22587_1 /TAXON_ID=400756 /ORGANISM="Durinskia baltica, Strain CSIRO CS-38" /LENGTH=231 /DNA_ID=CAMNT_0010496477 /DNA_START=76 /DNA_END=771 /DNA_ORIENTATION=+
MGQGLDVLKTCDGACNQSEQHKNARRKCNTSSWEDEATATCAALEDGVKSTIANANRGGARVSDAVLLNHELLQHARQGNVKGVGQALERGAWTETRRPLVMKPQKPESAGEKGAKPTLEQPDVGMTALMFSSQAGSSECVRRLLWAGAEVNAVEEDGWSALHFAAKEGHYEVCAALLQGRANPQLVNGDDQTPLQLALEEEEGGWGGFGERLQTLIEKRVRRSEFEDSKP